MASNIVATMNLSTDVLVENDTGDTLTVTLQDSAGNIVDLTGASVQLDYFINNEPPLYTKNMTVATDPRSGVASYTFTSGVDQFGNTVYDLYSSGIMYWRVVVSIGSNTYTFPNWNNLVINDADPT